MSKYLVTGGCGFIGTHLVQYLLEKGNTVRILDVNPYDGINNVQSDCEIIQGDVNDYNLLRESFDGVSGCFHLAGQNTTSRSQNYSAIRSDKRVEAFDVFRAACSSDRTKPIPVVYASTSDVYGDNASVALPETAHARPFTALAVEKLSTEFYAQIIGLNHGLATTGLRLFGVYGPSLDGVKSTDNLVADLVRRILTEQPICLGKDITDTFDLIHVHDVCRFFDRAMERSQKGNSIYNVCTGRSVTLVDLIDAIAALCNTQASIALRGREERTIHTSIGNPEYAAMKLGVRATINLSDGLRSVIDDIIQSELGSGSNKHTSTPMTLRKH